MHNNISDGAEKPEGDEKVALSTAKPSASGDTLPLPAMYCTRPDLYTMGTAEKEHAEPEREIPFMLVPGVTTDEKLAAIGIYRSGVPDDEQVRNVSGRKSLCVDEAANTAVEDGHVPPLEMANATCLANIDQNDAKAFCGTKCHDGVQDYVKRCRKTETAETRKIFNQANAWLKNCGNGHEEVTYIGSPPQ